MIFGAKERNCLFDKSLKIIFCRRWLCCGIVWTECRQQAKLYCLFWTGAIIIRDKFLLVIVFYVFYVLTEFLVVMFQITKPGRTRSTGDSRAAALITTRLQREARLGSLAKRNIKTWRLCRNGNMNDTPSSLRSTSKVRIKPLGQSKTSAVLGGLPPSTDNESDEGSDDSNGSSSSNTQKEGRELFHSSLTSPPAIRKSMKRTRSKDEKVSPDKKSRNYGELVTVMKESASHLVRGSADRRDPEQDSFFTWLNDFTSKLPIHSWRTFQMKTVALAMEITPAESPQPNTARSRIEPEQQQQQQQPHSIYPPPRAIGPAGTTFIDLTQAQPSQQYQGGPSIPNQMVSAVLSHSCRMQVTTCLGGTLARSCCMLVL